MVEKDSIKTNINETGRDSAEPKVSSERDIVAGSCERGNEPSGSTKFGEFVKQLSQYQAIKGQSLRLQLCVYKKKLCEDIYIG
jgi:hypothetical protein